MFLGLKQTTVRFHLETEVQVQTLVFVRQVRVVRVLHEPSGILAVQLCVDIGFYPFRVKVFYLPVLTGEIDHRTRAVVLGLHIQSRHTGCVSYFLVVRTESRCDVYDTCTVFGRHIITRNDAISTLARVYPREERVVLQTYEVRTFVTGYDFGVFEIRGETGFCENNMFAVLERNLHIIYFRSYAEGGVGRQCPRCCSPRNDIPSVFQMELCRTGQILHITVTTGLVQLVARQTRSRCRRVRLNGVTLVEVTFLVQLLEQVPQRLDILVVVGDIGVLEVHPVTHFLRQISPFGGVFHHLTATRSVVFIDANLLTDVLFGDTEHFLHAQLHRQTMRVPTGFTTHLETLHRLETTESVLNRSRHHMVNTRLAVRRRRSFEEQELRVSFARRDTLTK